MLAATGVGVGVSLAWCQAPLRNPEAPDAWTLTVDITAAGQDWTVHIAAGTGIALVIDWGDGWIEQFATTGYKTHVYGQPGRYHPKISGGFASGGNIRLGKDVSDKPRLKATSIVPTIPGLIKFQSTFNGCTSLTSLPADLFRYNTAVSASGFYGTFNGCTSLTSLPADLFRYNTLVSTSGFYRTFNGCTALTTLPDDLFRYNTLVSSSGFSATFTGCTGITTLPADLFRYNTLVSTSGFQEAFIDCTGLTTLPADLFRYNTLISDSGFVYTLYGCNKLQLRSDIFFRPGEESTRFLDQSPDFSSCFQLAAAFTGTQGTAPALWDCTYGTGTPVIADCFQGHSAASVDNYSAIPVAWT